MPRFLLALVVLLTLTLLAACAGLEEPVVDPDPPPRTKTILMGCANPISEITSGGIGWELTVDPGAIVSGQPFAADLKAVAIFDAFAISVAQLAFPGSGGFKDAMLVELHATVHVREGAMGEDVLLTPEPIPYVCEVSRTPCNPDNDLPGTERVRANTDCQPQTPANPCGRFVEVPTSDDCDPGGFCESVGRTGPESQCELNGFCVSDSLRVPLEGKRQLYEADASGTVLFGFEDRESTTGATLVDDGECNDGTWTMPIPSFEDPLGPNGVRVILGVAPVALECVMGEDSRGDFGIDSCDPLSSPTENSRLIRFPIQTNRR